LSFFLHKESSKEIESLERAIQNYQKSTCDTSVKQAVENLFKDYHNTGIQHGFLNPFKHSESHKVQVNPALVEEAMQIAQSFMYAFHNPILVYLSTSTNHVM
jgi:hypothetical protein